MDKRLREQNDRKKGHTYIQWAFAILANTLSLSYGFECGWISPITKKLQSDTSPAGEPLSNASLATIASAMSMSAVFGVPIFAYFAERFGSKFAVILLTIPQTIAWGLRIFYCTSTTLIIARIISGISAGGLFNVIPMYVKEISEDRVRGVLGSLMILSQNTGIFIIYVLGAYTDYYTVIYIATSLPILCGILLFMKAPQSPAYLVKRGRIEDAIDALSLLRGLERDDKKIHKELEYMTNENEQFKSLPNVSFKVIWNDKAWRRGFCLIMLVFTFNGANGAYAIVTYASTILVSTGVEIDISPEIQTLSIPFVMIISSLILTIIIERCKRKCLLSSTFFITSISMGMLAATSLVQQYGGNVPSWLPILAMVLTVSMYSAGVSPLPYIVMTEMFNFQVRAKVMGYAVTYAWILSFFALSLYAPISALFGQHAVFIIYSLINVAGAVVVFLLIPETRNKSDEEIKNDLMKSKRKPNDLPDQL